MSEPVITAVITGFISALGTFISVAAFVGRRIDRVDDDIHALDEKFGRKFDILMLELLRHVREGHPPNQAA